MRRFTILLTALLAIFASATYADAFEVKSYEGKFSMEFPGAPAASTIRDIGSCVAARHEYRFQERSKVWMASYQDCKPAGILADLGHADVIKNAVKRMLKAVKGDLRANDPITVGVLQGREVVAVVPGGLVLRQRFFIEGDRVYQNMYVGPIGSQDDPAVEAFFASFRVMR
ncbi:MAG TPA: hypothetical protein VNQ34_03235 [Xanthobacteraceae bacterium]|jgi:hypothetical protein|nr:hypothetical protein [Xanthobacteraceae bacterium]